MYIYCHAVRQGLTSLVWRIDLTRFMGLLSLPTYRLQKSLCTLIVKSLRMYMLSRTEKREIQLYKFIRFDIRECV